MAVAEKILRLREILGELDAAVVAYSGGADSAFLADVANEVLGERAQVVTAVSPSLAPDERAAAARLASERGWRHREVATDELGRPEYVRNESDRCYHCKSELFDVFGALFAGTPILVGTNVDDLGDHRPGQAAAVERAVRTPLVDAGLRKSEVRELSRERGLPTWDKPASACLSSRIAYGIPVTPERLERVGRAEAYLRSLGIREVRVRDHGELARIEVPARDVGRLAGDESRHELARVFRELGFLYVTLDLEGFRTGSMNAVLQIGRAKGSV